MCEIFKMIEKLKLVSEQDLDVVLKVIIIVHRKIKGEFEFQLFDLRDFLFDVVCL